MSADHTKGGEPPAEAPNHVGPLIDLRGGRDHANARRARRAFRFSVAAVVAFTFSLWFSEGYLRYDKTESQYRMALTLPTDSARAILRNVVKRDSETGEVPNGKYVEALASIEEVDMVLSRYEQAYRLNPGNPFLIINFGCRLFQDGRYKEARERFREAGIQPIPNALPRYLEAAALVAPTSPQDDLSEAVAILARTNSSGVEIVFPQPLWHSSLPARGVWYAQLRRDIADRCCAPLYLLKNVLVSRARNQIETGQVRDWDSWLEKLQTMGERLVGTPQSEPANLGVSQAVAGIQIQLDTVNQRRRISEIVRGAPDTALITQSIKLEDALRQLNAFEGSRKELIDGHRVLVQLPLKLSAGTAGLLLIVYFIALFLNRLMKADRSSWTVPHSRAGMGAAGFCLMILLLLLFVILALEQGGRDAPAWRQGVTLVWWVVVCGLIVFGVVYPLLSLGQLRFGVDSSETLYRGEGNAGKASHDRRLGYLALMRRYYGILFGSFICMLCFWIIGHRLLVSLYPMHVELLVTGLESEEYEVVRKIQEMLL